MGKAASARCLAILLLCSCSGSGAPPADSGGGAGAAQEMRSDLPRDESPAVPSADAARLAADNLAFGLDLFRQVSLRSPKNLIFSQTSVSLALAMVYAGAAGDTATQMAAALHFTLPPDRLHPAFDALDLALAAPPAGDSAGDFRLAIANSAWLQAGFPVLPSYLDVLAQSYGAGVFVEDFARDAEAAREDINRWVSEKTEQKIPDLLAKGSIDAYTRLVLADAVYFHGAWSLAFEPTSPNGTFHTPAGDVSVPMMSSSENNAVLWAGGGWRAAQLPYLGGQASMMLVVPDAGTFEGFERALTADTLATILRPAQPTAGAVSMPRFKLDTTLSLEDVLEALGMTDAFDATRADFSGMTGRRDLSIGSAVQKAIISVDENGTTAAAATAVTMVTLSLDTPPSTVLVVDRPFLFFIRHDPTGTILFQGRVIDPSP